MFDLLCIRNIIYIYTWNPFDLCFDRKRHEKTIFGVVGGPK